MHESDEDREPVPRLPGRENGMERESEMETEEIEILDIEGQPDGDYPRPAPSPIAPQSPAAVEPEQMEEVEERFLRLRADFDNYRKRNEREREALLRHALADPLRELLPVVDNLDRALAAQGGADDLRRGVELITKQLRETLRRFGLADVPALGERFDPKLHEAVLREESADVPAPTVVAELQRGYLLHDRLLRPAMVKVAMPMEDARAAAADDGARRAPDAAKESGEEEA